MQRPSISNVPANPAGARRSKTRRLLAVLLPSALFLLPMAPFAVAAQVAPLVGQDEPGAIAGQYVVVLNSATTVATAGSAAMLARSLGGDVRHTYSSALRGFSAKLPAAAVQALRRNPSVAWIEADQRVYAAENQSNATWGLDRIDQRSVPLDGTYTYNTTGSGVTAYIIDSGIRFSHSEFGGRAISGLDVIDGGPADDCYGHGTHVAGTVGGSTYGVAKAVTLVGVRVLGCDNTGSTSGVIAGIDWVTSNHQAGQPAVANMSLGCQCSSPAEDTAVNNSINDGITYAVAAMNWGDDACYYSPARVPAAITVGATDSTDTRPSWSDYGSCLDIFAPGSHVTSAGNSNDTATQSMSGTSMATPHVTGVAALYLENNPTASPATVRNAIVNGATTDVVIDAGSDSPNRLLYSAFVDSPPTGPANDNFSSAQVISGSSGTIAGSNVNATGESGERLNSGTSAPVQSVWYSWTASTAGDVTIDTCGSNFDTTLGAYLGAAVDSLGEVAANDDDPTGGCGLGSRVSFAATAGLTYLFSVDGYRDANGDITLNYELSEGDHIPPAIDGPTGVLVAPQTLSSTAKVHMSWAATDASGIAMYELQMKKGTGIWTSVTLKSPTATSTDLSLTVGAAYRFRVRATDGASNTSAWSTTSAAKLRLVQENATTITYSGTWKRVALTGASGGYVKYATASTARAKLTFTGAAASFVTTVSSGRGICEVWIDGSLAATIDTYSSATTKERIVYATPRLTYGAHTIEIRVKGTKRSASTSTRVDLDAFLTWP